MTTLTREAACTDEDAFLALVLADEELFDAEFDAHVAAVWAPGPPLRPPPVPVPAPSGGMQSGWAGPDARRRSGERSGSSRPGTDDWDRERSPPG
jgi:hypothetical protein